MARKLTEHRIRSFTPKARRYSVTEDGLMLEINVSGRRVWYAKYRDAGVQVKEKIGTYPDMTLKDAREAVRELQLKVSQDDAPVRQSQLTLAEYIKGDFKDWCMSARKDGQGTYDRLRLHFIDENPELGTTRLRALTPKQIEHWQLKALRTRMPATVARVFGDLRRAMNLALQWGYIRQSPMRGLKPPRVDSDRQKLYLDDVEFSALTKAINAWEAAPYTKTKTERRYYPAWFILWLRIALNTGARKGEILQLTWNDIDTKGRTITFRGTTTKSAKTRRIPISDELADQISYHAPKDTTNEASPVFPVRDIKKPWTRLMGMAGLDITPHHLRHHVASTLVLKGAPLSVVRDLLGHSSIEVTTRYLSVRQSDKLEALNLL